MRQDPTVTGEMSESKCCSVTHVKEEQKRSRFNRSRYVVIASTKSLRNDDTRGIHESTILASIQYAICILTLLLASTTS